MKLKRAAEWKCDGTTAGGASDVLSRRAIVTRLITGSIKALYAGGASHAPHH